MRKSERWAESDRFMFSMRKSLTRPAILEAIFHKLTTTVSRTLPLVFWLFLWLFALITTGDQLLGWALGDRFLVVRLSRYLLPWIFLALLIALIPALWFRRSWLMLALAGPALVIGCNYLPLFLPNTQPPPGNLPQLTIMSFNVWSENQSLQPTADLIRKELPDILLLQEIEPSQFQQLFLALNRPPEGLQDAWHFAYAPQLLQAVASRYPVRQLMADKGKAKVLEVRVETAAGRVTVFNVHPKRGNWTRRHRQLQSLLQNDILTTPGPVILGGDFNTTDQSETYRMLSRHLRNAHWQAGWGFGFSYPAHLRLLHTTLPAWPLVRIDHIFYNRYFSPISAGTINNSCGSDHRPVITRLALTRK